jgi:hypothetical protein
VPHVLAVVAADAAGVVDPERSLDLLVRHALLTRTDTGGYGLLPAVRARAALRLGENLRVTVLLDILRACLAATAVPPLPVTEHDSVGPVAAALVHEPVLTAADRQRLAAQLGPWWSGRLGGRRARDLLGEALALGRHGAATAALHLAIARTYGPGTETVETEHHLHEAARLLGEVDPVPASLVERLRQTVAGQTESEPGTQADGTLPADRTGEP